MLIFGIFFSFSSFLSGVLSLSCGIDSSHVEHVSEGFARIETYPWLGVLYYPYHKKKLTTSVILVTRQLVIATALEIDKLPKKDFRARARVVIGHNCSVRRGVGIRDYSFHPDYSRSTFSTLALIQLEIDHVKIELRPICPPPSELQLQNQHFFAMVLSNSCDRSALRIHKMIFVSKEECKNYYRRAELDIETLWPTYTTCARSVTGGDCIWRSGAILVVKEGLRWRLLGFGVYGPGCQAPARFLDYGMYHEWVQRSVERVGRPAISKLASNYIVFRRSLSNIQRFGPCDEEEIVRELYTELVEIRRFYDPATLPTLGKYNLNLTIIGDIEYSCLILRADYKDTITNKKPTLRLRRYCAGQGQTNLCFTGLQFIQINFDVEITFDVGLKYSVVAYGRRIIAIDSYKAHKYANRVSNLRVKIQKYEMTKLIFHEHRKDKNYPWYDKKNMTSRNITRANMTNW